MEPRIRIEMEGLKAGVISHMERHNDDFNLMVKEELEKTLTEDWVSLEIQKAVHSAIRSAITNLSDSWHLKSAVDEALGKTLAEMIRNA